MIVRKMTLSEAFTRPANQLSTVLRTASLVMGHVLHGFALTCSWSRLQDGRQKQNLVAIQCNISAATRKCNRPSMDNFLLAQSLSNFRRGTESLADSARSSLAKKLAAPTRKQFL